MSWEDLTKFRIIEVVIGLAQEEPVHRQIFENFLRTNFLNGSPTRWKTVANANQVDILTIDSFVDVIE